MQNAIVGILRVVLGLDSAQFESGTKRAADSARVFERQMQRTGKQLTDIGRTMSIGITAPLVAFAGASTRAAIQFESSFAGITKTVDDATDSAGKLTATGAKLQDQIKELAKVTPISVNELNKIGEAAGQLGIKTANIAGFVDVMAKLGVTTNLTGEEAATMLARFDNITTGGAQQTFEQMGAVIVHLGNNLATTEREILEMSMRLAGAGTQIKLSQTDILSLGGALSSLGLEAEAGGSAFSRVMIEMQNAVMDGGESLKLFSEVAGKDFAKAFKEDAAQAINDFIAGLARMQEEGRNVNPILDKLGLGGLRVSDALRRTGNAVERLSSSIATGREGMKALTALNDEARKRYETTASQLVILRNHFQLLGITIGNAMLPTLNLLIGGFQKILPVLDGVAKGFERLPTFIQAGAIVVGALVAAIGPLLFMFGQLAFSASALAAAFTRKGIATRALIALMPGLTVATAGQATASGVLTAASTAATAALARMAIAARAVSLAIVGTPVGVALLALSLGQLFIPAALEAMPRAFENVGEAAQKSAREVTLLSDSLKALKEQADEFAKAQGLSVQAPKAGTGLTLTGQQLAALGKDIANNRIASDAASRAMLTLVERHRELEAVARDLKPVQRANIDAGLAMGLSAKEIAGELTKLGEQYSVGEDVIQAYSRAQKALVKVQKEATDAARELSEQIGSMSGQAAIASANQVLAALDGLSQQGIAIGDLSIEEQQRINGMMKAAIDGYRRLAQQVPGEITRAFTLSAAAVAKSLDLSAIAGWDFEYEDGKPTGRLKDLNAEIAGGLSTARMLVGMTSELDLSQVIWPDEAKARMQEADMQIRLMSIRLQQMADDTGESIRRAWILPLDLLVNGFQALGGASASGLGRAAARIADFVAGLRQAVAGMQQLVVGIQAITAGSTTGQKLAGWSAAVTGGLQAAAGMSQATGSGSRGERIAAGSMQGGLAGASLMSSMGAGAKIGSKAGWWGIAAGVGIGALVGWYRSRGQKEIEGAQESFAAWADQVLATFDIIATEQQRIAAGGDDWKKITLLVESAYRDLGMTAEAAHRDLNRLQLASLDSAEAVARELERINEALKRQSDLADARKRKQEMLNEAVERWGISFEEAGRGFQRGQLAQSAERFIEDWKLLIESGMDPDVLAGKMAGAVNEFIQQAIATGTEVPEAMKPIIETLIDMGLLVDGNGKAFRDLEGTGIKFGRALESMFERVLEKLEALIELMSQPLPALIEIPKWAERDLFAHVRSGLSPQGRAQFDANLQEMGYAPPAFKAGGIVPGQKGKAVPIVAHAGEGIVNSLGMKSLGLSGLDAVNAGKMPNMFSGMGPATASVSAPMLSTRTTERMGGSLTTGDSSSITTREGDINVRVGTVQVVTSRPDEAAEAFIRQLPRAISRNQNGIRSTLRRQLTQNGD